jgi:hypothetical protein
VGRCWLTAVTEQAEKVVLVEVQRQERRRVPEALVVVSDVIADACSAAE